MSGLIGKERKQRKYSGFVYAMAIAERNCKGNCAPIINLRFATAP